LRRRPLDSGESLELLLDTISNAFGGILFVTILLTLLLRMSHRPVSQEPVEESARQELVADNQELDAALAELEVLEQAANLQTETRDRLANEDLQAAFEQLQISRQRKNELQSLILQATRDRAREQERMDEVARQSQQLEQENERLESAKSELASELKREKLRRTQSMVPPQTKVSTKLECMLVVRYGRVYLQYSGRSPFLREINHPDFVLMEEDDGTAITPKPYAGLPIREQSDFKGMLADKLSGYDARNWFICLAVWEDSFEEFAFVKKALVELGYEYRLIAATHGDRLAEMPGIIPEVQ